MSRTWLGSDGAEDPSLDVASLQSFDTQPTPLRRRPGTKTSIQPSRHDTPRLKPLATVMETEFLHEEPQIHPSHDPYPPKSEAEMQPVKSSNEEQIHTVQIDSVESPRTYRDGSSILSWWVLFVLLASLVPAGLFGAMYAGADVLCYREPFQRLSRILSRMSVIRLSDPCSVLATFNNESFVTPFHAISSAFHDMDEYTRSKYLINMAKDPIAFNLTGMTTAVRRNIHLLADSFVEKEEILRAVTEVTALVLTLDRTVRNFYSSENVARVTLNGSASDLNSRMMQRYKENEARSFTDALTHEIVSRLVPSVFHNSPTAGALQDLIDFLHDKAHPALDQLLDTLGALKFLARNIRHQLNSLENDFIKHQDERRRRLCPDASWLSQLLTNTWRLFGTNTPQNTAQSTFRYGDAELRAYCNIPLSDQKLIVKNARMYLEWIGKIVDELNSRYLVIFDNIVIVRKTVLDDVEFFRYKSRFTSRRLSLRHVVPCINELQEAMNNTQWAIMQIQKDLVEEEAQLRLMA